MSFKLRFPSLILHKRYLQMSILKTQMLLCSNVEYKIIFYQIWNSLGFESTNLKKINFCLHFHLVNRDFRLLFRELELFFMFSKKIQIDILNNKLNISLKTFNILRSPFIYSKSKEHLGYYKYNSKIVFKSLLNIIYFHYFMLLYDFFISYSKLVLIKILC